jgi:predicted transcriptional regulator
MRLKELVEALDLEVHCGEEHLDREVTGGYVSDLMSDVIAHAEEGTLWVTLQTHANTAAVAAMKELSAVVLIGGRRPEPETLEKARARGVPLLASGLPAFELVGRLYSLGVRGRHGDAEGA